MYYAGIRVFADRNGVRLESPRERSVRFRGKVWAGDCCIDVRAAGEGEAPAPWAVPVGDLAIAFGCGASVVRGDVVV